MNEFFEKYFSDYSKVLASFLSDMNNKRYLSEAIALLRDTRESRKGVFLIGNGGSMAIAEHMAIDLTKNARLNAKALGGSTLLTTFSNDYGYDYVFQKTIENYANEGDILIAISSSGASKNILNGCGAAKNQKMKMITFSGFESDNPLRKMGHINFWVDSCAYGYVELIHNLLLHYINDAIIGSAIYPKS